MSKFLKTSKIFTFLLVIITLFYFGCKAEEVKFYGETKLQEAVKGK